MRVSDLLFDLRYGVAWGVLDISDRYATHHVLLSASPWSCACGLLCRDLTLMAFPPRSGVVDDLNPMLNFTRKEVENLLHSWRRSQAPQTSLNVVKGIKEPVLQLACLKYLTHHQGNSSVHVPQYCTPSTERGKPGCFIQSFISCGLTQLVLFLPQTVPPLSPLLILSLSHPSSVSSAMRIIWPWWVFLAEKKFWKCSLVILWILLFFWYGRADIGCLKLVPG